MAKKNFMLFALVFIFIEHSNSLAAGPAAASASANIIDSQSSNADLNTLLKIQGVQTQYDACKKVITNLADIPKCIWEGNNGNPPALDPTIQEQVKKEYEKTLASKDDKTGADKVDYTNTSSITTTNFANQKNPGIKKLSDEIEKKLHEAMYGAQPDKSKISQVSQTEFHDLYKTEISKGVVDALTSYCLNVDFTTNPKPEPKCTQDKLCNNDPTTKTKCEDSCLVFPTSTNAKTANLASLEAGTMGDNINLCIRNVANGCYYSSGSPDQNACVVADYLKAAKKNIELNDKISKTYSELDKGTNLEISNLGSAQAIDQQKILTVTSKDVENAFQNNNDYKTLQADATQCAQTPTDPKCKEFLDTNTDEKKSAVAEFGLRQIVQGEELKKNIQNATDTKQIQAYLKDEGYSQEKIDQMTAKQADIEIIKKEIINKFDLQKKALVQELADRVDKTTSRVDGSITAQDDLSKISTRLQQDANDLKEQAHFSNIASSYLNTENKSATNPQNTPTRNVASIQEELKANPTTNTKLQEQAKSNGGNSNQGISTYIDIQTINDILGI